MDLFSVVATINFSHFVFTFGSFFSAISHIPSFLVYYYFKKRQVKKNFIISLERNFKHEIILKKQEK
jgi:hypothetical protein